MPASRRRCSIASRLSSALASMSLIAEHCSTTCCSSGCSATASLTRSSSARALAKYRLSSTRRLDQPRAGRHRVAQHVAEVFGARHQPTSAMCGRLVRYRNSASDTATPATSPVSTPTRQRRRQRRQHRGEVGLRVDPGAPEDADVDQREHGHDDGRGERGLRQEVQRRREQQRGERDAGRGVDAGRRCAARRRRS